MIKNRGPATDPWNIPTLIFFLSDLLPLMSTYWVLPSNRVYQKKVNFRISALYGIPCSMWAYKVLTHPIQTILQDVNLQLDDIGSTGHLWSVCIHIVCLLTIITSLHVLTEVSFKCWFICWTIPASRTFEMTGSKATGQYEDIKVISPFPL